MCDMRCFWAEITFIIAKTNCKSIVYATITCIWYKEDNLGKKKKKRDVAEENNKKKFVHVMLRAVINTKPSFRFQNLLTWTAWIILATSTFVFPFTVFPFTPVISSPAANVPSRAAGVLSNTWETKPTALKGKRLNQLLLAQFQLHWMKIRFKVMKKVSDFNCNPKTRKLKPEHNC